MTGAAAGGVGCIQIYLCIWGPHPLAKISTQLIMSCAWALGDAAKTADFLLTMPNICFSKALGYTGREPGAQATLGLFSLVCADVMLVMFCCVLKGLSSVCASTSVTGYHPLSALSRCRRVVVVNYYLSLFVIVRRCRVSRVWACVWTCSGVC